MQTIHISDEIHFKLELIALFRRKKLEKLINDMLETELKKYNLISFKLGGE